MVNNLEGLCRFAKSLVPNRVRLFVDRTILGKDSEIVIYGTGSFYCPVETYVEGSKTRKIDLGYDGIRVVK